MSRNGDSLLKGMDRNFPVKLHYMLSELVKDGLDHIVCWRPHGRCFGVNDLDAFVERILPTWFQQSKFASFQRQLNLYGFQRITAGLDKNCYHHPCFLRNTRSLANMIKRSKVKGQGCRKPSCPSSEPNFYLMPYIPEESPEQSVTSNENMTDNNVSANHQENTVRAERALDSLSENSGNGLQTDGEIPPANGFPQNVNSVISNEQPDLFQLRMLLLCHQLQQQQQERRILPVLQTFSSHQPGSRPVPAQFSNEPNANAENSILPNGNLFHENDISRARPHESLPQSPEDSIWQRILPLLILLQSYGNRHQQPRLLSTTNRTMGMSIQQIQELVYKLNTANTGSNVASSMISLPFQAHDAENLNISP